VTNVKRKLANISQLWLLIFDNADSPNLSLMPYFPAGDRGDVIITSRNPEHGQYSTVGSREIGRMSLPDSTALLVKIIHGTTAVDETTLDEGRKVVETLGCLALAITQAGAYVRETSCGLGEYLELFLRRKKEVMGYHSKHAGTDYRYTVYTTWQVSLDRIETFHDTISGHALELLKLLSFYHHDRVPLQMFYNAWHNSKKDLIAPDVSRQPKVVSDFDYRQLMRASVTLLASFSLVRRDSDASLSLHPLVHDWCQDTLSEAERQIRCQRAASLLAQSIRWGFETEDFTFRRSLASHVHACLRDGNFTGRDTDDHASDEWASIALVLRENGSTREAVRLSEQVVRLRKCKLGEDHPDTLYSMRQLTVLYSEVGRLSEALQLTEQVVQLHKSKLGEDHPDVLTSKDSLASRYGEAGRQSEAIQLTEQVVQLRKSKLGEDHPHTLSSMYNLAVHYSMAGRQSEALQLTEQVVQLRKSKLGEDHPYILLLMNSLAILYSNAGRQSEALQLTEQVLLGGATAQD
jgi:tetratricopeptide (TPR) repeat protein